MYPAIACDTFSYVLTMDKFRSAVPDEHKPSWVKITTITMVSSVLTTVDIQKLRSIFETRRTVNIRPVGSTESGFSWELKPTTFYNQITLMYTDHMSTKSIKVFPNGSVQVAGCSDLFDCKRVILQLTFLLKTLLDIEQDIPADSFRVVMINSNFSLNYNLNLFRITDTFSDISAFNVSFDPDRYSAVKIKFRPAPDMKQVTTSIFSTGKIIVTGAETLKEIVYAYHVINQVIFKNHAVLKVSKTAATDVFDSMFGYKIPDLLSHLKSLGLKPLNYTTNNFKINF